MSVVRVIFSKFIIVALKCSFIARRLTKINPFLRDALRESGFGMKVLSSEEDFKDMCVVIFADSGSIESTVQVQSALQYSIEDVPS